MLIASRDREAFGDALIELTALIHKMLAVSVDELKRKDCCKSVNITEKTLFNYLFIFFKKNSKVCRSNERISKTIC